MGNGALGPEGMEDALVLAGIKDPRKRAALMRDVYRHHLYLMQRDWPHLFSDEDLPPIRFPEAHLPPPGIKRHLLPANPDLEIKCRSCKKVKRAGDHFYHRSDTKNGWGHKCRDCIAKPPRDEEGRFDDLSTLPAATPRPVPRPAEAAGIQGDAEAVLVHSAGGN